MSSDTYYILLGWTREEWLTAARWAKTAEKQYPPTIDGGCQLQEDWRAAHESPLKPEELWFVRFRGEVLKACHP